MNRKTVRLRSCAEILGWLENALDFAQRSIPYLATPSVHGTESPSFKREKFIAETALFLYAAEKSVERYPQLSVAVANLSLALLPHSRSELLLTSMRLRPMVAPEMAVAHVCLTRLGYPDSQFQKELERILAASVVGMFERVPWKDIEADWLAEIGGPRLSNNVRSAVRRCTLATGLDALSARRQEIYAFTHSLIYLTDFGRRLPRLPRPASAIIGDADAALVRCLDEDDFDLAAEILLTWPYLRVKWTPTAIFGMGVLARLENQVGVLPSLSLRQEELSCLHEGKRAHYVADEAYHTAYVMGLLSAALLDSSRTPPATLPTRPNRGASQCFHSLLLKREPIPQWQTDFSSLPNSQQESLIPLLATVGLRRALIQYDFRQFHRILEASIEHGLTLIPSVRQGAELLSRLVVRSVKTDTH